jgi:hypothetical protein
MAAPTRQIIVDLDFTYPQRWKANGAAFIWTRRVYFRDFAAAAVTGDLDVVGFPGAVLVEGAYAMVNTPFTGGAAATATLSAGTTGSPALYMAAQDVFSTTAATPTAPKALVGLTLVPGTYLGTAATPLATSTVRFRLTTTVGNTNVLTAGVADVFLRLRATAYRAK